MSIMATAVTFPIIAAAAAAAVGRCGSRHCCRPPPPHYFNGPAVDVPVAAIRRLLVVPAAVSAFAARARLPPPLLQRRPAPPNASFSCFLVAGPAKSAFVAPRHSPPSSSRGEPLLFREHGLDVSFRPFDPDPLHGCRRGRLRSRYFYEGVRSSSSVLMRSNGRDVVVGETGTTPESTAGRGFGTTTATPSSHRADDNLKMVHVPLVFVPGMKGTHLAFADEDNGDGDVDVGAGGATKQKQKKKKKRKRKRVWLTMSNLLNFPPRTDGHPSRDLLLPLEYEDRHPTSDGEMGQPPRQHRGNLVPDGIVDHIIEFGFGVGSSVDDDEQAGATSGRRGKYVDLNFLPFYGHATRMLRDMDQEYHRRRRVGVGDSTESFRDEENDKGGDEYLHSASKEATGVPPSNETGPGTAPSSSSEGGGNQNGRRTIFDRVGSFVERTSFSWTAKSSSSSTSVPSSVLRHCRPTAVFPFDWRRSLPELSSDLHDFCEETFPGEPVQIVAHSMGGLMAFGAMRTALRTAEEVEKRVKANVEGDFEEGGLSAITKAQAEATALREKYSPGAVVIGVPFGTGIQYLQDLHKGYYTELDRCRQFLPEAQFTMSSHWSFFPTTEERCEDRFVDVTEHFRRASLNNDKGGGEGVLPPLPFDADKSGIGKTGTEFRPDPVLGNNAYFNFYDPEEWEKNSLGVFGPEYDERFTDERRDAYKEHMHIQMELGKKWRKDALGEDDESLPLNGEALKGFPPLVACASDAVPTVNQILRRKRVCDTTGAFSEAGNDSSSSPSLNEWEYDYSNGRSVPGDGRIDYDKAFPPKFAPHKRVTLSSAHAKQMCWEDSGGSWGAVWDEVVEQAEEYLMLRRQGMRRRGHSQQQRQQSADRKMAGVEAEASNLGVREGAATDTTTEADAEARKKRRRRSFVPLLAVKARRARKRWAQRTRMPPRRGDARVASPSQPRKRLSFLNRRK